MRAFQSSVLAHTVAKACRTNTRSCSCANLSDDLLPLSNEDTTYIPQCSDHIEFGIEFAKLFLRKGYTGGVSKKVELELHNIKVGLHVSSLNLFYPCMSAILQLITCNSKASSQVHVFPPFIYTQQQTYTHIHIDRLASLLHKLVSKLNVARLQS